MKRKSVKVDDQWIDAYEQIYKYERRFRIKNKAFIENQEIQLHKISPNQMQKEALQELQRVREENETKALIISATGERVIIVMGAVCVIKSSVSGTLDKYISCID
ncbi:hypothetical protein [Fusibacter tunisiensis]|uniref:Uncharacterized protein n=1 Tax=Fusibacter tunisiensis TaxID=1008308 RepID=A0ABS2MTY4_9FIRM|nr:hypothetical protein [Fusibacter tunisiensis]MBM7562867.1 hypothetical protein [Fusibacter tunisiensis]